MAEVRPNKSFVLTLSCADRPGIVASVTNILAGLGCNIAESAQFWDRATNRFFMRIAFEAPVVLSGSTVLAALNRTIETFGMKVDLVDGERVPKILIMVSKFDHCLQHLLYQIRVGWLKAEVVAIVSNHEDARPIAAAQGIPYYNWPVEKGGKAEQEARVRALVEESGAELVVLARYMQILSNEFSSALFGRIINIHHSFLPSFKGAKPYHQAHERGVKLIGATAHYVTPDLDEGPIIEQETCRVSHALSPDDLIAVGRDNESRVLARAVKMHLEARVLLHGIKTVVFS
jgi:formyltetrahydrofolate deformylase